MSNARNGGRNISGRSLFSPSSLSSIRRLIGAAANAAAFLMAVVFVVLFFMAMA